MWLPDLSRLSLKQADTGPRFTTNDRKKAEENPGKFIYKPDLVFKDPPGAKKARPEPPPPPSPPPVTPQRASKSEESEESESDEPPSIRVYSAWAINAEDDRSVMMVRRMKKPNDPYATTDFVEVEIACDLFLQLSAADRYWKNDRGEPTDWNFLDPKKHKVYKDRENDGKPLKVDQPWLTAKWNRPGRYEIDNHEGRHRAAWICHHMTEQGYTHLTIVIGLDWLKNANKKKAAPKEGTVFREQSTGPPYGTRFAILEKNDREGATLLRLVKA